MLIGVISDTHGLLRPQVFDVFAEVDRILHAGDIGPPEILAELESLAPVDAVYGNTDGFPLVSELPSTLRTELGDQTFFMTHILPDPLEALKDPAVKSANAVIFGHSHCPSSEVHQGVLFFNPGSAGPRRFSLPISVGLIEVAEDGLLPRIVTL